MRIRHIDARTLNFIANEPDVLPYLNPTAKFLDLSWLYDKGAYVIGCDGINGACVFLPEKPGNYEAHMLFPGYGGLPAIRACFDWMFTTTSCQVIFGFIPRSNLVARVAARAIGALPVSEQIDGAGRPCVVYELTRERWASLQADQRAAAPAAT